MRLRTFLYIDTVIAGILPKKIKRLEGQQNPGS